MWNIDGDLYSIAIMVIWSFSHPINHRWYEWLVKQVHRDLIQPRVSEHKFQVSGIHSISILISSDKYIWILFFAIRFSISIGIIWCDVLAQIFLRPLRFCMNHERCGLISRLSLELYLTLNANLQEKIGNRKLLMFALTLLQWFLKPVKHLLLLALSITCKLFHRVTSQLTQTR